MNLLQIFKRLLSTPNYTLVHTCKLKHSISQWHRIYNFPISAVTNNDIRLLKYDYYPHSNKGYVNFNLNDSRYKLKFYYTGPDYIYLDLIQRLISNEAWQISI